MPHFHVTFARHIESIRNFGLGAKIVERNWDCEPGVYLANDPVWGLWMLIERAIEIASDEPPRELLANLRVIVVDDSRIDPRLLTNDPSFPNKQEIRRYMGSIDVRGMPVLDLDTVMADWPKEDA